MGFGGNGKSLLSSYRGNKITQKRSRAAKIWIAGLCTALVAALLIGACGIWLAKRNADNIWAGAGLFSWDESVVEADKRARLFDLMEGQRLTALYQHISSETPTELVQEFLAAADHVCAASDRSCGVFA